MISDGKISFRALEPDDTDTIFLWENDCRIWNRGCTRAPLSRHQVWEYISNYSADPLQSGELRLMIVLNDGYSPVGCIDLTDIDAVNLRAQVGIFIAEKFRNAGIGTAAVRLLSRYCHEYLGLHQLWSVADVENIASGKIFLKAGFNTCGSLKSWIKKGRSYSDALVYQFMLDSLK